MNIVNSLEESGLLMNCFHEAIKNEAKEQKSSLLSTLDASLLGIMLAEK